MKEQTLDESIRDAINKESVNKIDDYLEGMPRCEKSERELLDAMETFDDFPEIYLKLAAFKNSLFR